MRFHSLAPWLSLLARAVVGGIFAWAALAKIGDPEATVRAVRAYRLLPEALVAPVGYALPYVELALAVLLVVGLGTRYAAWIAAALIAVFVAGVASAWVRGLQIDCGCFGGGGATDNPQYLTEIVRDAGLLVVAVSAALLPRSRMSADNVLEL